MRKTMIVMAVGATSALLFGCSTSNTLSPSANTVTKTSVSASKPQLALSNVHVSKNDGQDLSVSLSAVNSSDKAIYIQPSDFALTSGSTTLSPTSQSQIPSQIPANSETSLTLTFNVKGQLSGVITPKLGFQPSGNEPEKFVSIGNVKIPVLKTTSAPPTSSTTASSSSSRSTSAGTSTTASSTTGTQVQSDNPTQDIAHAIAVIASKGFSAGSPSASIPDGYGKTLYAYNAVATGSADGGIQWVFFFLNGTYLGTDTAQPHSRVLSVYPTGTGSIAVQYVVYRQGDSMAYPTGNPFTIVYHWNGSRLIPNAPFQSQFQ